MFEILTIFLLLIGQKAKNSGCDWCFQLSDNSCSKIAICYWTLRLNDFAVRLRKNRVLNKPIRLRKL